MLRAYSGIDIPCHTQVTVKSTKLPPEPEVHVGKELSMHFIPVEYYYRQKNVESSHHSLAISRFLPFKYY